MNEEHTHLTTTGDEATEVRIIAWVLGEASAFEAAELEALCTENPEWRVFHRRMLALHDCLKEAHAPAAEGDWKLSAEKRGRLDEVIGQRETAVPRRGKPRRKWWLNVAGIAALLMLLAAIGSLTTGNFGVRDMARMERKETPMITSYSAEIPAERSAELADASDDEGMEVAGADIAMFSTRQAAKPSAPSSSITNTIAAAPAAAAQIPVPTVEGKDPTVAYGNGDDFGEGWGGQAGGSAMGGFQRDVVKDSAANVPTVNSGKESVAFNTRSAPMDKKSNAAEAQYELGKLDDAKRAFEQVLRDNPYDQDARRGMEKVAAAQTDYYRAAYDQTRAKLMMEVDEAWDLAVPDEAAAGKGARENAPGTRLREDAIIAGKMEFQRTGLADADNALAKVKEQNLEGEKQLSMQGGELKNLEKTDGQNADALALAATRGLQANAPMPKPQAVAPPLSQEITTNEEPYSTFSLRVSDNAFRIAQAAMSQNQRPPAESVRVEEFYNAFDYGDPIPSADEPVTAAMEQSTHPVLPQRNLLRIALRTASLGRAAGQPLRLTLLVDQSGSMNRSDRRAAMLASVQELCQMLQEQDQVSVIGFSRTPRLLAEDIPGNQTQKLLEIIRAVPGDGGTNLEEALKLAEQVAQRNQLPQAQNRLLLMTDGAANLGNADPARLSAWVKQLRHKNLCFDIAGIGTDGLNDALLVEIARHGNGRYYVMNDAAQAKQQFASQLAGAFRPVAENVKVQVRFNPQRVSRYQLIGFEKDRLKTEDFRNDKVDAAEMAAAEAGQALYQIELLPEGSGDIGEVSVRFRDVATQQMVERKWTIRHDATTPVFDRATPTMQLAGLAMLSAQKLQGGDFASMIRFSDMQEPRRHVRETFSQSRRVSELLQMIDQLQD